VPPDRPIHGWGTRNIRGSVCFSEPQAGTPLRREAGRRAGERASDQLREVGIFPTRDEHSADCRSTAEVGLSRRDPPWGNFSPVHGERPKSVERGFICVSMRMRRTSLRKRWFGAIFGLVNLDGHALGDGRWAARTITPTAKTGHAAIRAQRKRAEFAGRVTIPAGFRRLP
jgi:hypothetical protein